ncbi:uncharacterized protein CLAFUR5_14639 [Fulvia fulva]|uniref:Uncharacterized protein n=1 Tax=Passalora fulva TaxID=5499 RepID=A0A9Q8PMX5_PASFU|nr:uncharacterized protein CLAFUR5_14639 [Fulvia fulva]KAK4608896.1 hypothetical protein CLAFUR0_14849 [Fulvia fulva]UJO25411.1 hypothetical protein CLAFUR5_14639 [Fulvia fulva]
MAPTAKDDEGAATLKAMAPKPDEVAATLKPPPTLKPATSKPPPTRDTPAISKSALTAPTASTAPTREAPAPAKPPPPRETPVSGLQQCIADEFKQLMKHEEALQALWQRVKEGEQQQPLSKEVASAGRQYAQQLQAAAVPARQRRRHLLQWDVGRRSLSAKAIQRSDAVIKGWGEGAAAAEEHKHSDDHGQLAQQPKASWQGKEADKAATTLVNPSLGRGELVARRCAMMLIGLVAVLLICYATFHQPRPLTLSNQTLDVLGQPKRITPRISQRLSSIETALQATISDMNGLLAPEAREAYDRAHEYVQRVRQLWVDNGAIFDQPLDMDVRTATRLHEIADYAGNHWWHMSTILSWPALSYVLPTAAAWPWVSNRAGLQMGAVLARHQEDKRLWAQRASEAAAQGRRYLAAAQDELLTAQTLWLPIEAKEALTPEGVEVVAASQRGSVMATQLQNVREKIGEEDMGTSTVLTRVWASSSSSSAAKRSRELLEQDNNKKDGVDDGLAAHNNKIREELLTQPLPELRHWARRIRSVAECRLEPGCSVV